VDAFYFRVSSERQTTENQFNDLLEVGERDGSGRDWSQIRQAVSRCIYEEQVATSNDAHRLVYRVRPEVAAELAAHCAYVEQGRSSKTGAAKRPLFERMKRDAAERKFDPPTHASQSSP
jgi:hypothetical protein